MTCHPRRDARYTWRRMPDNALQPASVAWMPCLMRKRQSRPESMPDSELLLMSTPRIIRKHPKANLKEELQRRPPASGQARESSEHTRTSQSSAPSPSSHTAERPPQWSKRQPTTDKGRGSASPPPSRHPRRSGGVGARARPRVSSEPPATRGSRWPLVDERWHAGGCR